MKKVLSFDMDNERDRILFDEYERSSKILYATREFDNWLRGELKYKDLSQDVHSTLQLAREKLSSFLKDYDVTLIE